MNDKFRLYFSQLNEYWCSDKGINNPGYSVIQKKILTEITCMSSQSVIGLIDELTDIQINQIIPIVEDIIRIHPQTKFIFKNINGERNIFCLDNELRTLGLI